MCFSLIFTLKRLCFSLSFLENGYFFQDSTSYIYYTYISLYIYIYIYLYIYIYIYLYIYLSLSLYIYIYINISILYLSIIYLSIYLSIYLLCVNIEQSHSNCKKIEEFIYVYYIYVYIYKRRWSDERIKTKTTILQENSNTLTNMV